MSRHLMRLSALLSTTLPLSAYAVTAPTDFKGLVSIILGYVSLLIPLVFGLTFIILIWGIVRAWIFNGGNSEKVTEGQQIALWGVIGLVVMVGLWGLVTLLRTSFFGNI